MPHRRVSRRRARRPPPLTKRQILDWADAHHQRTGRWPHKDSGIIVGALAEKWMNVDMALRKGLRGLPGGSSLARLLAEQRGVRNHMALPLLQERQILQWADSYHQRTGRWPTRNSGFVHQVPQETWLGIHTALMQGHRGLPGGSSLAQLLAKRRGVRYPFFAEHLTIAKILQWADAHYRRTGHWPHSDSGPLETAPGETWLAVHTALHKGQRGLPGGSTLARLLAQHRGVRNHLRLQPLKEKQILAWADAYRQRAGKWPSRYAGAIAEAPEETWAAVDAALSQGGRGLPGNGSLPQLLAAHYRGRGGAR